MVSLLTGSVVAKFYGSNDVVTSMNDNATAYGNASKQDVAATAPALSDETKIGIAMTISMLVGFTQVI